MKWHVSHWYCLLFLLCGCHCSTSPLPAAQGRLATDLQGDRLRFENGPSQAPTTRKFLLYNAGFAPLQVEQISLAQGAFALVDGPALPLELPPGKEHGIWLQLRYSPDLAKAHAATLDIYAPEAENTDGKGRFRVELSSALRRSSLAFSCGEHLQFGSVKYGASKTLLCKLHNRGAAPLTLRRIGYHSLQGGREFRWKASRSLPMVLEAQRKNGLTVQVTYAPKDLESLYDRGYLQFDTDQPLAKDEHPPSFRVFGHTKAAILKLVPKPRSCRSHEDCRWLDPSFRCAQDPNAPGAICTAPGPPRVDFENGMPGWTFRVEVELRSQGNLPVTIEAIELSRTSASAFSVKAPKLPLVLAPGARQKMLVEYTTPGRSNTEDLRGRVELRSDAANDDGRVLLLRGIGNTCRLRLAPINDDALDFGAVAVGETSLKYLSLASHGANCVLKALKLEQPRGLSQSIFRLQRVPSFPHEIPGRWGQAIRFQPARGQSRYEGVLEIHSNDPRRPKIRLKLRGSTELPCLQATPESLDFGDDATVGCGVTRKKLEISNSSAAHCRTISIQNIHLRSNTGDIKLVGHPLVSKLEPGQHFEVQLEFKPQKQAQHTATLHVISDRPELVVPMVGKGGPAQEHTDRFTQKTDDRNSRGKSDVLWIIDDSPTMAQHQLNALQNLKEFINWASRLAIDLHMGVIPARVSGTGPVCLRGSTPVIKKYDPDFVELFLTAARMGSQGSKNQGLEAAYRALSPKALAGCNRGFLRKGADLTLIFISSKPDQSPQTMDFYIHFFRSLKGRQSLAQLRAHAVVGPPSSGCIRPGVSRVLPAPRYWEVAKQLKGVRESICAQNWARTLSNVGIIPFGYRDDFFLSRPADPSTLQVRVEGKLIPRDPTDGWSYDSSNNSIAFTKSQRPPKGAKITVRYKVACPP